MLIKLPEALSASNSSRRGKKGLSLHNTLCDIGQELNANLTEIKEKADAKAAEEAKKAEAESVLKKLLAEGMSADEILAKLK